MSVVRWEVSRHLATATNRRGGSCALPYEVYGVAERIRHVCTGLRPVLSAPFSHQIEPLLPSIEWAADDAVKVNDFLQRQAHRLVPFRDKALDREFHREAAVRGKADIAPARIRFLLPRETDQRARLVQKVADRVGIDFRPG